MEKYAIIVAGGSGTRMGSTIPKQFLLLDEKPILFHTIEAFIQFPEKISIILVLPEHQIEVWGKLCKQHQFTHPILLAQGGTSRFESVRNGLSNIPDTDSLVAIHDGVRPLVTEEIIRNSYNLASEKGSAIAATPLKESIRMMDGNQSSSLDRTKMRLIQTPQTFQTRVIKKSFGLFDQGEAFTDDASVAEKAGFQIHLFEGSYQNIKITTPEDMLLAQAILKQKKSDK